MTAPCPGCGAVFPPVNGPTHEYIGASPGCWAVYTALLAGAAPSTELNASFRVPTSTPDQDGADGPPGAPALLVDAYAVQHHGVPSPQATQSVAIHLLALHRVLERAFPSGRALWIRRRALRERGVFRWLEPPPPGRALTIRHLFGGGGVTSPVRAEHYLQSVHAAWRELHHDILHHWFDRYVMRG